MASQYTNEESSLSRPGLRTLLTVGVLGTALAAGTGCSSTMGDRSPVAAGRTPVRFAPEIFVPLETPSRLRIEYAYPGSTAFQNLRWDKRGFQWSVRLADTRYAHAGVLFHRPCDLSEIQNKNWVTLEMKPALFAEYVHFGFVDNEQRIGGAHLSHPLSKYHLSTKGDWGKFAIPLEAFCEHVQPGASTFDWSNVVGIQLTRADVDLKAFRIEVRSLQFQSDSYELSQLVASK